MDLILKIIVDTVAENRDISVEDMLKKTRKREIVTARQEAMSLARKHTCLSLVKIGEMIGNKDHATVLHAEKVISNLLETDKLFKHKYDSLDRSISLKLKDLRASKRLENGINESPKAKLSYQARNKKRNACLRYAL
jgi:hypothetical protein